jgi:hypothetical protein
MASEELPQIPRKGHEIFLLSFTLQTVVTALLVGAFVQEVGNNGSVSVVVGVLVALATHPVRGTELGMRGAVLVRHLLGRRRTVHLGAATLPPTAAPLARVHKKERGWRYTP